MPTRWINDQSESLRQWLTNTHCPMLVSTADGGILWANTALEELLDYTVVELVGDGDKVPGKSWVDLTVSPEDLAADQALVRTLEKGHRTEYRLQKAYRKKSGEPVTVLIQVLRWPPIGDVECFLVSALPLGFSTSYLLTEFQTLQKAMFEVLNRVTFVDKVWKWARGNRVAATALFLFLGAFLFGDRVLEIAHQIGQLIRGTGP